MHFRLLEEITVFKERVQDDVILKLKCLNSGLRRENEVIDIQREDPAAAAAGRRPACRWRREQDLMIFQRSGQTIITIRNKYLS